MKLIRSLKSGRPRALPRMNPSISSAAAGDVATVPSGTRKEVTALLEREERERRFELALGSAGRPHRPKGWTPKAGERVVGNADLGHEATAELFEGGEPFGAKLIVTRDERGRVA